jgi:hypothetical protein
VAERPQHITPEGVKIYRFPLPDHDYIMTVDTSHGKGLDYHAFSVIDITQYPFEQVAVYRNNELSTLLYPDVIKKMAVQYNEAYVLIETNDLGGMVAADMNYDMEYENLLSPKDPASKNTRAYELGIRMTASVKSMGCSNFRDLMENQQLLLHDQDTQTEIAMFVVRGRSYEADPKVSGSTDDCVITLVLFSWLVKTSLFADIYENKILKQDMFKSRIEEIEQSLLPTPHLDDGLDNAGNSERGAYDSELGMYEVGEW